MIELLIYAMITTRLNLIYSLWILLHYCINLNLTHVKAVIRVFKYIKKILNYDVYYENKKNLIKYIDVDFAEVMNNYCFINDYTFFLSKNLISWSLKR